MQLSPLHTTVSSSGYNIACIPYSYVWIMWSAPLQIAIALWQLYETIGVSLFAGLAIMLVMMPLNGLVAAKQRTLQIQQMKLKDERIKMMNEVLSGIRVS